MAVSLAYAMQGGILIHISEKIKNKETLLCPHCHEGVIPKKGTKMEHHFAHKPYSTCSATPESILHFESKMYLKALIEHKTPIHFECKLDFLDERIKRWFTILNAQRADISLVHLLNAYEIKRAEEEKGIAGYIPDLLGEGKYPIAFEIFVTHAMEEPKINTFKKLDIHYIELIPKREEDGTFSYQVHDGFLPRFFDCWAKEINDSLDQEIKPLWFQKWSESKEELIREAKKEIQPEVVSEVCQTIQQNLHRFYVTRGETLSRKQEKTHVITPDDFRGIIEEELNIKEVFVRIGNKGLPYMMLKDEFNRNFYVDQTIPLFSALLNELNQQYELKMGINQKGNVESLTFINNLDKIGYDNEIQLLIARNLEMLAENAKKK